MRGEPQQRLEVKFYSFKPGDVCWWNYCYWAAVDSWTTVNRCMDAVETPKWMMVLSDSQIYRFQFMCFLRTFLWKFHEIPSLPIWMRFGTHFDCSTLNSKDSRRISAKWAYSCGDLKIKKPPIQNSLLHPRKLTAGLPETHPQMKRTLIFHPQSFWVQNASFRGCELVLWAKWVRTSKQLKLEKQLSFLSAS